MILWPPCGAGDFSRWFAAQRGTIRVPAPGQGGRAMPSGSIVSGKTDLEIAAPPPPVTPRESSCFETDQVFRQAQAARLDLADAPDGMYRAEVYLQDHPYLKAEVPWICSNPIGINIRRPDPPVDEPPPPAARRPIDHLRFRAETDATSRAAYTASGSDGVFAYTLSRPTSRGDNRWCALAMREPLDLSGSRGVYIDARSIPSCVTTWSSGAATAGTMPRSRRGRKSPARPVWLPFQCFYRVDGGRESCRSGRSTVCSSPSAARIRWRASRAD